MAQQKPSRKVPAISVEAGGLRGEQKEQGLSSSSTPLEVG